MIVVTLVAVAAENARGDATPMQYACVLHEAFTKPHISTIYTLLVKLSLICGSRSIIRRDEPNEHVADHTRSRPLSTCDVTNITPCCTSPPPGDAQTLIKCADTAATQLKIWQRSAGDDYSLCKCVCSLLLASRFVTVSLNWGGGGGRGPASARFRSSTRSSPPQEYTLQVSAGQRCCIATSAKCALSRNLVASVWDHYFLNLALEAPALGGVLAAEPKPELVAAFCFDETYGNIQTKGG
ncbi:hypothetical protein MTP99_019589 [Tenebrio molitor]|jgi:hypothetical protein|nr:hypothetical protein MTP99_019589 [Tenebrio molitor]